MTSPFRLEVLGDRHDRSSFSCGTEALDRYLRTQATQDIRRRLASCFVALESTSGQIAAYYTLSAASIQMSDLPPGVARKLPRYPSVPAARIGRLAVDLRFQGRGLGAALIADAVDRVVVSPAAVYALVVDAKDERAAGFYACHGFVPFKKQTLTLYLPVETAQKFRRSSSAIP